MLGGLLDSPQKFRLLNVLLALFVIVTSIVYYIYYLGHWHDLSHINLQRSSICNSLMALGVFHYRHSKKGHHPASILLAYAAGYCVVLLTGLVYLQDFFLNFMDPNHFTDNLSIAILFIGATVAPTIYGDQLYKGSTPKN